MRRKQLLLLLQVGDHLRTRAFLGSVGTAVGAALPSLSVLSTDIRGSCSASVPIDLQPPFKRPTEKAGHGHLFCRIHCVPGLLGNITRDAVSYPPYDAFTGDHRWRGLARALEGAAPCRTRAGAEAETPRVSLLPRV